MAPAVSRRLHPDFCNKIGTKQTCVRLTQIPASERKADIAGLTGVLDL
jgi:hypothetical protein